MKKTIVVTLFFSLSISFYLLNLPNVRGPASVSCTADEEIFTGNFRHIFFHPILFNPEAAFKNITGVKTDREFADLWFITDREFYRVLNALWKRNYQLVNFDDFYSVINGEIVKNHEVCITRGKIPLVISIDDPNYYPTMRRIGTESRTSLDANGNIIGEIQLGNTTLRGREYSYFSIVEDFIKAHPSFSLRNAKGIIAPTGYLGLFGYYKQINSEEGKSSYNSPEYQKGGLVRKLVATLKQNGWKFASHTYCHINVGNSELKRDSNAEYSCSKYLMDDYPLWEERITPLIGKTDLLIYPFGSGAPTKSEKFSYLQEKGFRFFFTVDNNDRVVAGVANNLPYFIQGRIQIDGTSLRKAQKRLFPFLGDIINIYDERRPFPLPSPEN